MRTAHTRPDSAQPATTSEPTPAIELLGDVMLRRRIGERVALRGAGAPVVVAADRVDRCQPVTGMCHAPWLLIEAGVVRGRTIQCPSPRADLRNARASWVNWESCPDGAIHTSARLADLRAFCAKLIAPLNSAGS